MTADSRLLVALPAVALAVLAACGDDAESNSEEEKQVSAISENAAYAWLEDGPEGVYDYLSLDLTRVCTKDEIAKALSDVPRVTAWRDTTKIEIIGATAIATIRLETEGGEIEQGWNFIRDGANWRISAIPGLEECFA